MNGRWTARSASRSATLVWVRPARVDDRDVEVPLVQSVDQRALVVRLEELDASPSSAARRRDARVDLVERLVAVDLRLARPEQVEVRALEDEHARHRRHRRTGEQPVDGRSPRASSGTSRPDRHAVRRRKDPAQPAARVLLVGAERFQDRGRPDRGAAPAEVEAVEHRARPAPPAPLA